MTDLSAEESQKLWDELAAGQDTEGQTASVPPAAEVAEPAAAEPAPAATEAPTEAAPATDQPSTTAAPAAADAKPDPLAELAEKIGRLEGQLRNVSGHIGGLNQGQQQLRQMLDATKAAQAAGKEAPTQEQVKEALKNPAEWEALQEDFPEWKAATEKFLDARLAALQQPAAIDPAAIDKIVAERVAQETAAVRNEAIDAHLDAIVDGDWRAEVQGEAFGKWMQGQPADVQALGNSSKLTDASRMMRLYAESKKSNPAQQLLQQRSAKLDAAAGVPRGQKAPRSKSVEDMGPEELWAHYAAQTDKRLRG